METQLNLLIREKVKKNEYYFTNNIGTDHSIVDLSRKRGVANVLNDIRFDIDIDFIAEQLFDEIVAIQSDYLDEGVSLEAFEYEVKRLASLTCLGSFKSNVTPKYLLEKLDWISIQSSIEGASI